MVKLEAEVEKLRAMEQVRQQGDKERHLLRLDKDKEHDRLTQQNDQLQSVNQGLRKEIVSMEEHLVEVQEATSEHGSLVGAQDARELVSHASDHSCMTPYLLAHSQWKKGARVFPAFHQLCLQRSRQLVHLSWVLSSP